MVFLVCKHHSNHSFMQTSQWNRIIESDNLSMRTGHDDVIKWLHFPRNWPFVREIHRSPVNFPHKGQWRGALMFSLIYAWINDWVNNREAGDLRRQHGHYDVIVMKLKKTYLRYLHRQHIRLRYFVAYTLTIFFLITYKQLKTLSATYRLYCV